MINFGRGCIYTTAPSPAVMERNYALWQILPSFAQERAYLQDLGRFARNVLEPFHTRESSAHILPLKIDSVKKALEIQEKLLQSDIAVSCVRPPSIPSSILRLGLTIDHTKENILELKDQLEELI